MTWSGHSDAQAYGAAILNGDRVRLRPLEDADLPDLVRWWRDPEWAALQQLVVRPQPEQSVEAIFRAWSANTGDVGYSVVDRADGTLLGHATLYGGSLPARAATLAMLIGAEHVGRGFGTDAVRTLARYGFRELGLHRIELRTWAYNTRARAAYARAGFVEEGVRREVAFHDGAFHDEVIMAVLADEWRG